MADFFKASGFSKYTVRTSVDQALASDPDASSDPFMKIISSQVVPYGKQEPALPVGHLAGHGNRDRVGDEGHQSV